MASAIGFWAIGSIALTPFTDSPFWYLPAITIIPLLFSGYISAKYTASDVRIRKVILGIIGGTLGFAVAMLVVSARGELLALLFLYIGAAFFSAIGAYIGSKQ